MTSPIAAGGLVLDIGGALALASAFMFKRPRAWRQEATTYVGMNAPYSSVAAKQTAEAQIGAVLLTAGFAAQFSASVGANPAWACLWRILPVAIALDVIAAAFLFRFLSGGSLSRPGVTSSTRRSPGRVRSYPPAERLLGKRRWRRLETPSPPA